MRIVGIFLALTGAVIIIFYILYKVFQIITAIPTIIKVGIGLVIIGGILLLISIIRERSADMKKESFRGTKQ